MKILSSTSPTYVKPDGNWSTILVALPVFSPSLYIVKLYITVSPVFTTTGSFLWLYVAVVPVPKESVLIFGFLLLMSVFPTFVIYFLKLKSNILCVFINV